MSELDQLRQEAEQLKNQIRVCIVSIDLEATVQIDGHLCFLRRTEMDKNDALSQMFPQCQS